jgi:predicted RNA-binding Zn ribbon-like protein
MSLAQDLAASRRDVKLLPLVGGALCLDFANTVDPRSGSEREEFLDSYPALVEWAVHAGAIAVPVGRRLVTAGAHEPARAQRVLRRALALREAIYRLFAGQASARSRDDDLALVTDELHRAFAASALERRGAEYVFTFAGDDALDQMLWPVARSALELLTSPDLARVKECDGVPCGWLFLDRSKAGRRRWCSMDSCGNRVKARRYRDRRAAGRSG